MRIDYGRRLVQGESHVESSLCSSTSTNSLTCFFSPWCSTITPIRVAHEFSLQVFFSIWGEDAHGEKLAKNGPGHMRKFTTLQSTLIMSVSHPGVNVSVEPDAETSNDPQPFVVLLYSRYPGPPDVRRVDARITSTDRTRMRPVRLWTTSESVGRTRDRSRLYARYEGCRRDGTGGRGEG
jgi:hypothetical protein